MGHNESKPPKLKINQNTNNTPAPPTQPTPATSSTTNTSINESRPKSWEMANSSIPPFQNTRNNIDCVKNSRQTKMSNDNSGKSLGLDKTTVGFSQQKDACLFLPSKKPDQPNQTQDSKLENQYHSLNSNRLKLNFEVGSEEQNKSTTIPHELKNDQYPNIFTTNHQQNEKEFKQSTFEQKENQPARSSIAQVIDRSNDKEPGGFSTTHPLKLKHNKQPVSFSQTKSQEQKEDKQSSFFVTSLQEEKKENQQVFVPTSKPDKYKDENYQAAFFTGQPLVHNNSNLPKKPEVLDQPVTYNGSSERNVNNLSLIIPCGEDTANTKSYPLDAKQSTIIDSLGSPKQDDDTVKKTLKQVAMIADSLKCSNVKHQCNDGQVRMEYSDLPTKGRHNQWMVHNIIVKMRNVRGDDKEFVVSLQKEITAHLREVELFTSVLKSCPIINSSIYSLCETIRGNLNGLKINCERKNPFLNSETVIATNFNGFHPSYFPKESLTISPTDHGDHTDIAINTDSNSKTNEVKIENVSESRAQTITTPLYSFKALLDRLPESLVEEKQNISLRNTELFCRVCEESISFSLYALKEHLTEKNHCARVLDSRMSNMEEVKEVPRLASGNDTMRNQSQSSGPSSSVKCLQNASDAIEPALANNLPPNYKDVLDLINKSVTKGLTLNVEVFICLLCDFLENDNSKASSHVKMAHEDQQNGVWHFCKSCRINMYGTEMQLKDHYVTVQHINIAKIKEITIEEPSGEKSALDSALVPDENDRGSVCSSSVSETSTRSHTKMTTHEILLAIVKTKKEKNIKGPYGMYCQACKKYFTESAVSSVHLNSRKHIQFFSKISIRRKQVMSLEKCSTCEVFLFGDENVLREHSNLQVHKELVAEATETNYKHELSADGNFGPTEPGNIELNSSKIKCTGPVSSEPRSPEPSSPEHLEANVSETHESGPHYEFMKKILKKHFEKKPMNVFYGLYCHVCKLHFLEQAEWESHLQSRSHHISTKTSEHINIQHNCIECNVNLICDETFFDLHLQSWAHKAISKIPGRKQVEEPESEDDYSEDESDSCENEEESEESIRKQGNTQNNSVDAKTREEKNNRLITVPNGVYFKGFPRDLESKEVSEYFRRFGPIKTCKINRGAGTGSCVFKNKIDATLVLQKKNISMKKTPVSVQPLIARSRKVKEKKQLNPDVVSALSSRQALAATITDILSSMIQNFNHNKIKINEITQDLAAFIPGSRALLFGSQVTGLATGKSDFDIYIDYDGKSFYTDLSYNKQQKILEHLQLELTRRGSKFVVRETILEARVPIIRVVHMKTNTLCDISCRSGLSVENSHLVKVYLDLDPRVRWLVVAIKFWMQSNGLLDCTAFTSYATVWLVLFFLMSSRNPVVCPVVTLQQGCHPNGIARWDCRFHRDKRIINSLFTSYNQQSDLELLSAFFETYASFPFKSSVLCPLNGNIVSRHKFETLNLPREFGPYVDKVQSSKLAERLRIQTPICLQDPFDLSHNITKGVSRTDLKKFSDLCFQSHKLCLNLMSV